MSASTMSRDAMLMQVHAIRENYGRAKTEMVQDWVFGFTIMMGERVLMKATRVDAQNPWGDWNVEVSA